MTFIPYQEILYSGAYALVAPQTNYVLDSFPETYGTHCTWRYQISSSVAGNQRGGTISYVQNNSTNAIGHTHDVLAEIGATTDFTFNVDVSSNTIRLLCTITGAATWTVQLVREIM